MTNLVTPKQARAWISEDRNHGVNINSGKLNDLCQTVIAQAAELAAAHADIDTLRDCAQDEMHRAERAEAKLAEMGTGRPMSARRVKRGAA